MELVWKIVDFFRLIAGMIMVVIGGLYVFIGHMLLTPTWRDRIARGLYLPLAEGCSGERDWTDLIPAQQPSESPSVRK